MREIYFYDEVHEDIESIKSYILDKSLDVGIATEFTEKLYKRTEILKSSPTIGKKFFYKNFDTGMRYLIEGKYCIFYDATINDKWIVVVAVVHGMRKYEKIVNARKGK